MLCRRCRKNDAEFVIKAAVRNKLTRLMLCAHCMGLKEKELGLEPGTLSYYAVPLRGEGFAHAAPSSPHDDRLKCPQCGLLYSEFRETGLLGCPHCYEAFRPQLEFFLKRVSGFSRHGGKPYIKSPAALPIADIKFNVKIMKSDLKSAVMHEDFEKAAKLRDIIKAAGRKRRAA
jgi:protein arginine kinase activator